MLHTWPLVLRALLQSSATESLRQACSAFDAEAPRVVIGCWQILERHADEQLAIDTLSAYAAANFTTFDTADIYGRSEAVLGQLRSTGVQPIVHTKFVTKEAGLGAARSVIPGSIGINWDY